NLAVPPSSITANAGTPQSTTVNTAFGTVLQALVRDASNNPLSGVSVTFAAPGSGASGTFGASATVTTDAEGVATAPTFTANAIPGSYVVTATVGGPSGAPTRMAARRAVTLSTTFSLTNLPVPVTTTGIPTLGSAGLLALSALLA